jgi:ribosomal peptide maturation radical SAM protein 1
VAQRCRPFRVLLVNMPFSTVRPALGVSLLKAHLAAIGLPARVEYLNMRFSKILGGAAYYHICEVPPAELLAGDWVFAHCLAPAMAASAEPYLAMARARAPDFFTEQTVAGLIRARSLATAFLDDCLRRVRWSDYDLVGFTTTFGQNVASLALARLVKERFPSLHIVLGGANCEGPMGLQLHRSFPFVDFVCSGEADQSFPLLVQRLASGGRVNDIRGVISRRHGESEFADLQPDRVLDLDDLPYPLFDDFFEQLREVQPEIVIDGTGVSGLPFETSRGCWWGEKHHCTFCGLNGGSMAYRAKTAGRALREILALAERYGTDEVSAVDNILAMGYFRELLPELKARGIGLKLFYETKANLTREQVRLLADAGVRIIQPGIESLSTHVLSLMRKGTTALQNIQLLKWCREFGVSPIWNLLYGFPGEVAADYEESARLMDAIHHLAPPFSGLVCIRVDRFSPFFMNPEQLGIRNLRPDRAYRYVYDLPDDALADLAYYFEYDYADGRRADQYLTPVRQALGRWSRSGGNRGLVYTDDGTRLGLCDFRPGAARIWTPLTGIRREIYLFCDRHRSFERIAAFAAERGAGAGVREYLDEMVEGRLMVAADGHYLALGIPAEPQPPPSGVHPVVEACALRD